MIINNNLGMVSFHTGRGFMVTVSNEKQQTKPLTAECITSSAALLFKEKGFRNATLEEIAESFGVTRQAIYYYFESKNDILLSIINTVFEKFIRSVAGVLNQELPPHEKLLKAAMAHAKVVAENATFVAVWQEERKQLPTEIANRLHTGFANYHKIMFDLYQQGIKSGHFQEVDPKIAVYTILGACQWCYFWYQEKKFSEPGQLAIQVVNLISKGFLRN